MTSNQSGDRFVLGSKEECARARAAGERAQEKRNGRAGQPVNSSPTGSPRLMRLEEKAAAALQLPAEWTRLIYLPEESTLEAGGVLSLLSERLCLHFRCAAGMSSLAPLERAAFLSAGDPFVRRSR